MAFGERFSVEERATTEYLLTTTNPGHCTPLRHTSPMCLLSAMTMRMTLSVLLPKPHCHCEQSESAHSKE